MSRPLSVAVAGLGTVGGGVLMASPVLPTTVISWPSSRRPRTKRATPMPPARTVMRMR